MTKNVVYFFLTFSHFFIMADEYQFSSSPAVLRMLSQALAWHVSDSPRLHYHQRKSRKGRLRWAMKSPPKGTVAWADIALAKFEIARPELILIDLT